MVFHIQPVPDIFPVSVHRELLSLKRIVDHQRNKFLRELIGSVIIGAVGNICRKTIRVHIGFHQHIRRGLAGRIRAVRIIGSGLIEESVIILRQRTIHFVRGHMQELFSLRETAVRQFPCRLGTVQHHGRAQHIGLYKNFRIPDTSVHMTLRRKMNHPVNVIFRKNPGDCFLITDIGFHKSIICPILHFFQILQISCICQ